MTVAGFFNQYEVQEILFPYNYLENELILIREECNKIEDNLRSLRIKLDGIKTLCGEMGKSPSPTPALSPADAFPSISNHKIPPEFEPAWQEALYQAKKKKVSAVRKLKNIDAVLDSMEITLMKPFNDTKVSKIIGALLTLLTSENPFLPDNDKNIRARILAQINDIRAHCQIYQSSLKELSLKLDDFLVYNNF